MTLQELYTEIGGNYENMLERFGKEERIRKFVLLFLRDGSYTQFLEAMEYKDVKSAFRAIHTLKGVCLNLGFSSLYEIVNMMTEALRAEDMEEGEKMMPELTSVYEKYIRKIQKYEREENE